MSRIVEELVCPDCGSKNFLKGPRGGAATNVKCADCGYCMNVTIIPRYIENTNTLVAGNYWITDEWRSRSQIEQPD